MPCQPRGCGCSPSGLQQGGARGRRELGRVEAPLGRVEAQAQKRIHRNLFPRERGLPKRVRLSSQLQAPLWSPVKASRDPRNHPSGQHCEHPAAQTKGSPEPPGPSFALGSSLRPEGHLDKGSEKACKQGLWGCPVLSPLFASVGADPHIT